MVTLPRGPFGPVRLLPLSVIMVAWWTSRSISAAATIASPRISPHLGGEIVELWPRHARLDLDGSGLPSLPTRSSETSFSSLAHRVRQRGNPLGFVVVSARGLQRARRAADNAATGSQPRHAKERLTAMEPEPEAAQPTDEDQTSQRSEEERCVRAWRYRQIRALGYTRTDAHLLAESDAELALIRRLIENGCPPAVALKITL
jgi:hypothetical protein